MSRNTGSHIDLYDLVRILPALKRYSYLYIQLAFFWMCGMVSGGLVAFHPITIVFCRVGLVAW
jgi:hypothetical protein